MGYVSFIGMLLVFGPQWIDIHFPLPNMVSIPLVVIR